MVYLSVSFNYVSVYASTNDLYGGLYYWPEAYCEVFSVGTMEEANVLARQIYAGLFYSHPEHFGIAPMSLPATGCYSAHTENPLYLPSAERNFIPQGGMSSLPVTGNDAECATAPIQANQNISSPLKYGAWSIVWSHGYGVAIGLEALVNKIAEKTYAHGKWYPDSARASFFAQAEYAYRMSRTCDLRNGFFQMPDAPVKPGQQYDSQKNDFDSSVLRTLRDSGLL